MAVQSIGPLFYVDGPLPREPRYTLVKSADINDLTDEHWANGIEVHGYIPDVPQGYSVCGDTSGSSPGAPVKQEQETPNPLPEFGPLTVYLAETCSMRSIAYGSRSQEEYNNLFRARANAVFQATESGAVARELELGEWLPDNPHFTDGNADVLTSGAVGLRQGLSLLEDAIAETYRAGVIHMTAGLAAAYSTLGTGALIVERGKLYTQLGTLVIPDYGYTGAAPEGETPATGTIEWAYATGPVEILRSESMIMPPNIWEAIDREQNEITYRAERYYIAYWDTALQAAVEIDRCIDNCEA